MRILHVFISVFVLFIQVKPHDHGNEHKHSPLEFDGAEHHTEEIEKATEGMAKSVDQMTQDEKEVFWFKLADYDNNDKIDAHEMIQAMIKQQIFALDQKGRSFKDLDRHFEEDFLIKEMDTWLKAQDFNNDGFVEFAEWKEAKRVAENSPGGWH